MTAWCRASRSSVISSLPCSAPAARMWVGPGAAAPGGRSGGRGQDRGKAVEVVADQADSEPDVIRLGRLDVERRARGAPDAVRGQRQQGVLLVGDGEPQVD